MTFFDVFATALLLVPPIVIAFVWRASLRSQDRGGWLPANEKLVLARVAGMLCALLPPVQLIASLLRYKTGELGTYLWFLIPAFGLLMAFVAMYGFLSQAHGYERRISSGMVALTAGTLLLLTLMGTSFAA